MSHIARHAWTVPAVVIGIHDGDTITVDADLGWTLTFQVHVRVAFINAPELSTLEGRAALGYLMTILAPGDAVTIVSHSLDKYGRTLGTVTLADGSDLGTLMIASGHAVPYAALPSYDHVDDSFPVVEDTATPPED